MTTLLALAALLAGQEADSLRIARDARAAQAAFEDARRANLGWTHGAYGACTETIGRICFWPERDSAAHIRPEPEAVGAARRALVSRLEAAAGALPGDDWIAGQRIRYLLESRSYAEALRAAARCGATAWWCRALTGLAHHATGDFAGADRAFAEALAVMPPETACAWTDLRVLIGGLGRAYADDCTARAPINQRIWWLADPLYLVPGNERRTEHYARWTMTRLLADAARPETRRWGRDDREVTLRYGWIVVWERERPRSGMAYTGPRIVGHHPLGARHFIPHARAVTDPTAAGADVWRLDDDRARSTYRPAYAGRFVDLEHQLSVFRRGDSAVVVAAFRPPGSAQTEAQPSSRRHVEAALAMVHDAAARPAVARHAVHDVARLTVRVAARAALVSVEALDRSDSVAARARYWHEIAPVAGGRLALSDLLLVDDGPVLPEGLDAAVARARPDARFAPGERIALYWEVYEPAPGPHRVTVSVTREGGGVLRRVAEWLGLAAERHPVHLEWDQTPGVGHAVRVALPEGHSGRFRLTVEIVAPDGRTAASERAIVVGS